MADFTPRPTIYKGTQMRSRLEAGFAAWLDRSSIEWEYEPFAVGDEHGQYLPDFVLKRTLFFPLDDTRATMAEAPQHAYHGNVAVEVKPTAAIIDMPRLVRAAKQLGDSGRCLPLLVLVVADAGTFMVWPSTPPSASLAELGRGSWVLDHTKTQTRTLLTFAAEPPLVGDWWT